jgi:hypothetical protein
MRDWAHPLSIDVLGAAGDVAGERRRRSRGSSISGEDRGSADQCVARVAPMWSSGGPGMVRWTGDQAEGGARRRLVCSGCEKSFSSEQAVRSGQHAGVHDLWAWEEKLEVFSRPWQRAEQGAQWW